MIYFDSSALVKQYIEEIGSARVNALLLETKTIATSRLAYPEILSAITRRHKAGDIKITDFERIKKQFKANWQSFTIIEIHKEIIELIDSIIEKYALRGADSIHLSTAIWLRNNSGREILFVAADGELLQAAKKEKMQICNPQD
jgi:predicted nucleic acid-binding protein